MLERVPVWRQLVTLPRRVSELEARIAQMEGQPTIEAKPSSYRCDNCFSQMHIIREERLDRLDVHSQAVHTLECFECGHVTKKMFTPSDGYL